MPLAALISQLCRPLASGAHSSGWLALLAASIHLVERRGRKEQLNSKRQVEIGTLLESIPEAAMIVDSSGRIVEVNRSAASLIGKTREQLHGHTAEEAGRVFDDAQLHDRQPIISRALEGQTVRHERRILRNAQSGAVHDLLVSANSILDDQGHAIAALVIARDISELSQLQQRVGDIERHRAIGQMAAALAHDFNNILDTIGQAAAVLEMHQDRPAEERKPLVDMIRNTVYRGAEMVQRIREYLRTGQETLRPVNVGNIIEEAVELTRPLWQKANVEVTKDLEAVPSVNADSADLRRVFTNLIINAIEAMPRGGRISIRCGSHENNVVATVADFGVGIPLEDQKRVFFAYFTTKPQGTGLGLSGAQKILLSYGGNIFFHSEVGKGTTFTVVLPAANGKTKAA